jgi:hypothetical protein
MPQAKKKKSTKTAKKPTAKKTTCRKKAVVSSRERAHIYFVTALSIITALLLCLDAAIVVATNNAG